MTYLGEIFVHEHTKLQLNVLSILRAVRFLEKKRKILQSKTAHAAVAETLLILYPN